MSILTSNKGSLPILIALQLHICELSPGFAMKATEHTLQYSGNVWVLKDKLKIEKKGHGKRQVHFPKNTERKSTHPEPLFMLRLDNVKKISEVSCKYYRSFSVSYSRCMWMI